MEVQILLIPGASTIAHLREERAASDLMLWNEIMAELGKISGTDLR